MKDLQNDRGDSASQHRHRAHHLQQLGRTEDALEAYRDALAHDPDSAPLLRSLAHCQMNSNGEKKLALATIERAIELDPDDSTSHALKSLIYSNDDQVLKAILPAEKAISLEPADPLGYTVLARAHLIGEAWAEAEEYAKKALELDPEFTMAANALTHALFRQGKQADNQVHLSGMLHRDPEDPYTHLSAGLARLQAGRHEKAEEHFLTALRLDPNMDAAREGLIDSFRSRSPFYRAYLKYAYYMMRFPAAKRLKIVLGMVIGAWLLFSTVSAFSKVAGLGIMAVYALFVVWTHVARSVGSIIILGDSRARHAMRTREKADALLVGGNIVLGMLLLGIGLIFAWAAIAYLGLMMAATSVSLALTFSNEHPKGPWLYGGLTAILVIGLASLPASAFIPALTPLVNPAITSAVIAFVAGPWLSNFRVWYR